MQLKTLFRLKKLIKQGLDNSNAPAHLTICIKVAKSYDYLNMLS